MASTRYLLLALIALIALPFAIADCLDLNDNTTWGNSVEKWSETRYEIKQSAALCPGTYSIPDGIVFAQLYKTLDCQGATLQGNGTGIGIYIGRGASVIGYYTPANTVKNCNLVGYHTGIAINRANGNTIENNTITSSSIGISVVGAAENTLRGNTLQGSSYKGIVLEMATSGYRSERNRIENNRIEGSSQGGIEIRLYSHNNTITKNIIENNQVYGVFVDYSENNTIYDNAFNNTKNAIATRSNFWSIEKTAGSNIIGGSFVAGNFWSDYTGTDADNDGIGDQAYAINSWSDAYPLTYPAQQQPPAQDTEAARICDHLTKLMFLYSVAGKPQVPDTVPFKDEVVNLYTLEDAPIGQLVIEKRQVTGMNCSVSDKPTFIIKVKDLATITDIETSKDPIGTANEKMADKDLTLTGATFAKKFKAGFAKIGLKVAKMFARKG